MALVPCHECGDAISDEAPTCPHCGVPRREVRADQRVELLTVVYTTVVGIGLIIVLIWQFL